MILLFNVKITSKGLTQYHRSNWLPKNSRLDIFKYCLASYTPLIPLFSKCILNITLDTEFADQQQELAQYIRKLYPSDKLELNWQRINYTREWRAFCEQQNINDDKLIWFAGNDDHIFIDSTLDVVQAGIDLLNNDPDPYSAIYYSHWPEQMRLPLMHDGELTNDGNYVKYTWRTFDAIRIIKGARFKRYWYDTDFGNELIFRTDTLYHAGYELTAPVYSPTRELVRHFDGYSHVSSQIINYAPPLIIPPGFFEKQMKVRVGYHKRLADWTNLCANHEWLYAANPEGTDYRWTVEDIPLFWKDHIAKLDVNFDQNIHELLVARDNAFLATTRIPMECYSFKFDHNRVPPTDWFKNHMRQYV